MDSEKQVFRSIEMIERDISEKLSVAHIADSAFFSKFYYQRLFREIVGGSVMEYVTKRRLSLAGKVLLETKAKVVDVAVDFGYDSREGFTRSFKAYMGVSPSEYRKYGLTAISQNMVKERKNMNYSKSTDEVIRELNEFIAKAKETAEAARKQAGLPEYTPFWTMMANKVDSYAERTRALLDRVANMVEHPGEITKRFLILHLLDDICFELHVTIFAAGLYVSRDTKARMDVHGQISGKFAELEKTAHVKSGKIRGIFNELGELIMADMRKAGREKIDAAAKAGNAALKGVTVCDYIRAKRGILLTSLARLT